MSQGEKTIELWNDPVYREKMSKAHIGKMLGNTHAMKDNPGYQAVHIWLRTKYGKANKCESKECLGKSKTYDWANISGVYSRNPRDYKQMCRSCHWKLDNLHGTS